MCAYTLYHGEMFRMNARILCGCWSSLKITPTTTTCTYGTPPCLSLLLLTPPSPCLAVFLSLFLPLLAPTTKKERERQRERERERERDPAENLHLFLILSSRWRRTIISVSVSVYLFLSVCVCAELGRWLVRYHDDDTTLRPTANCIGEKQNWKYWNSIKININSIMN